MYSGWNAPPPSHVESHLRMPEVSKPNVRSTLMPTSPASPNCNAGYSGNGSVTSKSGSTSTTGGWVEVADVDQDAAVHRVELADDPLDGVDDVDDLVDHFAAGDQVLQRQRGDVADGAPRVGRD